MHSYEDRIRAVELYYRYGKKASVVVMELGYPSTKQLGRWVRIYEEKGDLPRELKPRERYSRTQKIAQSIGVSVPVLYKWKKDLISDEAYQSMRKRKAAPQDKNQDALLGEIQRLRKQVHQLQLERDILTKANELIKKDLGVSFLKLKNREKTLIVDALKKKYPVAELLSVLQLARSCYLANVCTISMRKYA